MIHKLIRKTAFTLIGLIALFYLYPISLTHSATHAYVSNSFDDTVSVVRISDSTIITDVAVGTWPYGVAVDPKGEYVYVTNGGENTVSVIRTHDNTVAASIGVGSSPGGIVVSPDGAYVYVANNDDSSVSVIGTASNTVIASVDVGLWPEGVAVSPDGDYVYVANTGDGTISVIETAANAVAATVTVGRGPYGIAAAPRGDAVYVANTQDNTVTVVRTADNVVTATIPVGRRPIGIAVTPDSQYVYVATSEDNTVSVIRGSDHTVITTIEVGEWPYGIATTPDGEYVYVTNIADDTVSVIRTSDAIVTATVPVGADPYSLGNFIANVPEGPAPNDPAPGHLGSASSSSPSSGGGGGGGCFITTASCWSSGEGHGNVPSTSQDRHLAGKSPGHAFIKLFCSHALRFANISSRHASLYLPVRWVMLPLAGAALTAGFAAFKVRQCFGRKIDWFVCGGARDFKTLGFEMLEGYGMTEAAPMITFTRPGRWKIGAAGERMPCLEVKIAEGEIVARGRNIMQGYYNRPAETAQALRNGWLHTGDIGHLDNEGFIHVTGRLKEIIVLSRGKNIDPVEIEGKIRDLSDCISEIGVFPKDDSLHAAIYPNFNVLREKAILSIEEMFRWEVIDRYNRKASPHKKIAGFALFKDELPKTRLGNIQRFKLPSLSDQVGSRSREKRAEPDFEEYRVIRDFLTEQIRREVHRDDHVELDLGLDSLDKVALLTFLQSTFGVEVDEDILLQHPTVEKLSKFMEENENKLTVGAIKWADTLRQKVDLKLPRSWFTQNLIKNFSRVFFKLHFRLKGEGVENIPEGPFILASNHQSFFDGLFISVFLRNKMMKNTYFYAKEKHLRIGWLKALANRNNIIVMDINRGLKQSLQKLAEVLKRGKNVIIFPEGTRTRTGAVGTFKKAFAILSRELNVPVVPVSIKGAFAALPRGSFLPRPWKRIKITFHRPILPDGLSYETLSELVYRKVATEPP